MKLASQCRLVWCHCTLKLIATELLVVKFFLLAYELDNDLWQPGLGKFREPIETLKVPSRHSFLPLTYMCLHVFLLTHIHS